MSVARAFLDTNVLSYLLSSDSAKADRAESLIAAGAAINVQVLNEFAAVATRKARMPIAEVRSILTTIRRSCTVSDLDVETHDLGLTIAERYQFSLYDALIGSSKWTARRRTSNREPVLIARPFGYANRTRT